jgi:hypothetical protein
MKAYAPRVYVLFELRDNVPLYLPPHVLGGKAAGMLDAIYMIPR